MAFFCGALGNFLVMTSRTYVHAHVVPTPRCTHSFQIEFRPQTPSLLALRGKIQSLFDFWVYIIGLALAELHIVVRDVGKGRLGPGEGKATSLYTQTSSIYIQT